MSSKSDFADKVLGAFSRMMSEIGPESSEYDVRHRIIKYLVEGLLGYQGKDYQAEKNRTDIKLLDETHSLVLVVIETKRTAVDINEDKWKDQAFGYSDAFTKFIVLTNGLQLKVWDKSKRDKPLIDLDFEAILSEKRLIPEKLTIIEKAQISSIWDLSKENLWSEKKYQDFYVPEKVDITSPEGFQNLLEKLDFVVNQLLMRYALGTFNDYIQGFKQFKAEYASLEKESEKAKGNKDLEVRYEREKRNLEEKNQRFINFHRGYDQWLRLSNREDNEESKEVFCKETIYVLLNKILLVRICEDKGLVTKKVSNNGIKMWRQFASHLKDSYKDLLDFAYKDASQLYSHVYEKGLFDWYTEGDGELNRALNKVLYIFNHFDFGEVNRDILGKLYEKYLPKEERKRLGEFYTPDEIIDYILDAVGYTSDKEIEGKDLLDPACGSGGFLVRAVNRLIDRYKIKGLEPKGMLNNVISHIYGFDINPFACHIAEMNLLFQVIDLYQKAKEKDPEYMLPRFNVFQTDSLEMPKEGLTKWQYPNSKIQKYIEEKEIVAAIKSKKFHFVVGNPPYVNLEATIKRLKRLGDTEGVSYYRSLLEKYRRQSKAITVHFDLYMLFIERSLQLLREDGELGFITSSMFMTRDYGSKLRHLILENYKIRQIIDFGDSGVFQDVTNYPCILIVKRSGAKQPILCGKVTGEVSQKVILDKIKEKLGLTFSGDNFAVWSIDQISLADELWRIVPPHKERILLKMVDISKLSLGDICDFESGARTSLDRTYIVSKIKDIDNYKVEVAPLSDSSGRTFVLEKNILMPTMQGRNVRKWRLMLRDHFMIYPYKIIDGETVLIEPEEMRETYPCAYRYFVQNKEQLLDRRVWRKGMAFYAIQSGSLERFKSKKILSPALTDRNNFAFDSLGCCFVGGTAGVLGIIPKEKIDIFALLGILNSKLCEFYLRQTTPVKAGGYYQYSVKALRDIPIVDPQESKEHCKLHEEIAKLADEISKMYVALEESKQIKNNFTLLLQGVDTTRLDDYPSIIFHIAGNKLADIRRQKDKVYLNLSDHIECKDECVAEYVQLYLKSIEDKLRRTEDLRKEVTQVRIPKNRDDIEKVIKTHEKLENEMKKIPERAKALEKEIDQRVYKLYGLSEEEIKIVEESTAQKKL